MPISRTTAQMRSTIQAQPQRFIVGEFVFVVRIRAGGAIGHFRTIGAVVIGENSFGFEHFPQLGHVNRFRYVGTRTLLLLFRRVRGRIILWIVLPFLFRYHFRLRRRNRKVMWLEVSWKQK